MKKKDKSERKEYPMTPEGQIALFEDTPESEPLLLPGVLYTAVITAFKELEQRETNPDKKDLLQRIIEILEKPAPIPDSIRAPELEDFVRGGGAPDNAILDLGGDGELFTLRGNVRREIVKDFWAYLEDEVNLQLFSDPATAGGVPQESLEALRSIIPKTAVINNSKLAQNITKEFIGAGDIELTVIPGKNPARIVASLAYDDPTLSIVGRQPFTAYDRAVYNGVCSLFQAGNKHFTPAMVYRAMNGITERQYISPQAVGAVTRSIEKLRVTKLRIDCAAQLKAYPNLQQATLDDMLLSAKKVTVINQNGAKEEAYSINTPPILYEYSRRIGQVLSVPPQLLNSSSSIRSTDEVIVIREYLIRRIEGMKGKNALQSKRITYSGIYDELGIDMESLSTDAQKDKSRKIRNNTTKLLSHLQHENYIKGFGEYKDGRTVAGVEISL